MQCAFAILYFPLWPVWLCDIIPNYLINSMIFGKIFFNLKCVINFFKTCVWSISNSKKISARYITINTLNSSSEVYVILQVKYLLSFKWCTSYSPSEVAIIFCQFLIKTQIFSTCFRRILTKFHDNHSSKGQFIPCRQTEDSDGKANNGFSQFCERA